MNSAAQPAPFVGAALVFGSCVSLSIGAAFAAQLFPQLGAWGVTALRLGVAAIIMVLIVRPRVRGWNGRQWRAAIYFGLALGAMNGAFYAAIERIPLGPAVAIEFLGPLVLAAILTRRRSDAIWLGVAVVGIALLGVDGLLGADHLDPIGVGFALIAAFFWAMYIRATAHAGALIPGGGALAVAFVVASVCLLPFGIPAGIQVATDLNLLFLVVITALLASVIPYTLELAALRRLPQNVFGILLSLEPATAMFAGWFLLGQVPTALKAAAVACVMTASIGISATGARRRDATIADPATP